MDTDDVPPGGTDLEKKEAPAPTVVQGAVTGIIKPPPDVRQLVDKTAEHVAKNGKKFEENIKGLNRAKFEFLNAGHPFHRYYLSKVDEFALQQHLKQTGATVEPQKQSEAKDSVPDEKKEKQHQVEKDKDKDESGSLKSESKEEAVAMSLPKLDVVAEAVKKKRDQAPPDWVFAIQHPEDLPEQSVELIKLTARHAAVLGPAFIEQVKRREQFNPEFDFLSQHHSLFPYFTSLVDSYERVLDWRDCMDSIRKQFDTKLTILDRVVHRVEWKRQEEQKAKEDKQKTMEEIIAFNQIDWHDFVLVGTIDVEEQGKQDQHHGPQEVQVEKSKQTKQQVEEEEEDDDDDVDMDVSSDEEQELKVKKDYQPRVASGMEKATKITLRDGKQVDANELNEHMRVELLDPKWREQQRRFEEKQKEVPFAEKDAAKNLAKLAAHRPDVFGVDEETARKAREEAKRKRESAQLVWDGTVGSAASVKLAAMQTRHARSSEVEEDVIDHSIGPQDPRALPVGMPPQPPPLPPQPVAPPMPPPLPPMPTATTPKATASVLPPGEDDEEEEGMENQRKRQKA